ncbi:unnamed protein product [Sphenostylis stenocarpa]|uniref:SHSP domain-containing protein n=1 Tax=Sphenostylis stenocarpa TaxID=92480 RepID=A0AA86VL23_9FABA|nr:unnamed protein product [Sphenostylis stenocarpa]
MMTGYNAWVTSPQLEREHILLYNDMHACISKNELKKGTGMSNIEVLVDNGKVAEISGEWKPQKESKASDWRCDHWWEYGYVRRLEVPKDAENNEYVQLGRISHKTMISFS